MSLGRLVQGVATPPFPTGHTLTCLSESVNGENVCPERLPWFLGELGNTGLDALNLIAILLVLLALGGIILSLKARR